MVRATYDDDEEGSSDEDVAEDYYDGNNKENVADEGMTESFEEHDFDLDEFDYSLNKMSITPKNSFNHMFSRDLQVPMQMPSRIRPSTSPESL
ncbi:hypothetical protein L1049_013933 [Liquidambar formosana]|uniref:Uncharacterized protein n=1 Tax=Liquidambar formosana TaxID=63359 RepID=A0AAP0RR02_LIQFO